MGVTENSKGYRTVTATERGNINPNEVPTPISTPEAARSLDFKTWATTPVPEIFDEHQLAEIKKVPPEIEKESAERFGKELAERFKKAEVDEWIAKEQKRTGKRVELSNKKREGIFRSLHR